MQTGQDKLSSMLDTLTLEHHSKMAHRRNNDTADRQLQPPSLLLALPAELRTLIYEFAVHESTQSIVRNAKKGTSHEIQQPGLTRTNRSIRQQTLPLYYELTVFIISLQTPKLEHASRRWLRAIGPENRRRIKHVHVARREWYDYFRGLESFRRESSRFFKRMKYSSLVIFDDGHGYFTVELGCLTFDDD